MNRVPRILGPNGKPWRQTPAGPSAIYDVAQTTDDNKRHWIAADALSAKGANTLGIRKIMRQRARYECQQNNSYAKGIVLTLANDLIGTGPRLQVLTPNPDHNRQVERAFSQWSRAIGLAEKLRTMKMAKTVDGEAFALLTTNEQLPTSVKLDVRPIECDMVTSPFFQPYDPKIWDGIQFDDAGNPIAYHVLHQHPGDQITADMSGTWQKPKNILHWFRVDRPGQVRGVPEVTPALPLFAELRRYMSAVIAAAETACDFSAFMRSTLNPDSEDDASPQVAMSSIEIRKRMLTTLPEGWDIFQLKPEQPATTLEMFVWACMREIARCLNMPLSVALGDYSKSNYSSGRLDQQLYRKAVSVEQSHLDACILYRLVMAFLDEAIMVPGLLPAGFDIANVTYRFFFDGWEHVDPVKEASGDELDIANRTKSRTEICAERGRDWAEEVLPQLAKEEAALKAAGLQPEVVPGQNSKAKQPAEEADVPAEAA
jgi:lambda family phage portal protein